MRIYINLYTPLSGHRRVGYRLMVRVRVIIMDRVGAGPGWSMSSNTSPDPEHNPAGLLADRGYMYTGGGL